MHTFLKIISLEKVTYMGKVTLRQYLLSVLLGLWFKQQTFEHYMSCCGLNNRLLNITCRALSRTKDLEMNFF